MRFARVIRSTFLVALTAMTLAPAACGTGETGIARVKPTPSATATPVVPAVTTAQLNITAHHSGAIGVAWSPDGKRIATCGDDGKAQVWDATSGAPVWSAAYDDPGNFLFSIAWSPDGKRIAVAGLSTDVAVLDAATGHKLTTFTGGGFTQGLAWSPDSKLLAFGDGTGTVAVWDTQTNQRVTTYSGHTADVQHIAWSPDGSKIASASYDTTVQIWSVTTGQTVLKYQGHSKPVWSLAWSPDGTKIVSGTASAGQHGPVSTGNSVQVWDATTGKTLLTYTGHGDKGNVYALAWSHDGKRIASGADDKTVRVWDAATGQTALAFTGQRNIVFNVAWSLDDARIASVSQDGTLQVWQPKTA